ncbi:WASH complex subunit 2 isoform X2 [Thalassophryne amazonica]|uniref:WASH complex subunit 2 isoform X2 n=1 Tax=Thalassophryne amazonica TaxID=390379 RepID=UPI0014722193|nr:WASH complex subunit 2 isoform X2 [Thalassophryne amazonica]
MSGLPDRMANGPSSNEDFEKDAQIWERPWTLEQMRQTSSNWSLAADSGLFLFLQDFSQRMLSKTHEIEKQLDSLIRDTKATDSCLHSVFNDFLMLSNTQFIENRVYDEEVEETITKVDALEKQPEQEKTREQKEAELIPKMQEAVNYGLLVLESAFEHLDIKAGNSDSEDEEVTDRVEAILEPKDLYVDRPLPYLIGSQAFMEQDDVGLGDLSSDEMSVDRDSVIESEDDKEAVQSDDDFNQDVDEDHISNKKKTSLLSYEDDDEEDRDSDIFGESDKDDDDDDDVKNAVPSSFTDELAARIKGEPINKPEGDHKALITKKKSKGRKESKPPEPQAADNDSDDMFKPPKMDDDDFSPFGGKSGLFSGGKGLFDDDDEGDLFSEASKPAVSQEKALQENTKSTPHRAENNLFGSENESDSLEKKENGTPGPITHPMSNPSLRGGSFAVAGGGLFDDEDDDFFSGQSLKSTSSEKPKKAIDLFDEDEEHGDIFSDKYSASNQNKKEDAEAKAKPPEKKMPAGAVSLFGPGTKSLLTEGLKKHQLSTSEEPEKPGENGSPPAVGKAAVKPIQKPQARGLFSDDEDSEVFPALSQNQSKLRPSSEAKISKAPLSLFDDEEEEDLFGSATKSNPNPTKASTPQPKKTAYSSLFSDDEDQGISSKSSTGKSELIIGGMKSSASAPSNLPSAKVPPKSSLFDDDDEDDDLFAPTKETSQKPQQGALLFEDEDDEDKGSFFDVKPTVNTSTASPATKSVTMASQSPSEMFSEDQPSEAKEKPTVKKDPFMSLPPPVNAESKKKPAGAVSLFGGIDVLVNKQIKSPLVEGDSDDVFLSQASPPPPNVKKQEERKEEKVKPNTVSLFDDDDKEDESEWNDPVFSSSKPMSTDTKKPAEAQQQKKSTGVFQDEELLFSHTQQKDNDPDVDLFSTSGNPTAKLSSVKAAIPSLFADDEDDDDLFSFVKPKVLPPKVAEKPSKTAERPAVKVPSSVSVPESLKPASSPVKAKETSSRIGKLQANLVINPSALLPGAVPSKPGGVGVLPGTAQSSSSGVSSCSSTPTTPVCLQADSEAGVSFDTPVQVTTLQSTHKSRTKGSAHRRPQSRAARQQAAQRSVEDREDRGDLEQTPSLSDLNLPALGKSKYTHGSPIQPKSTVATTTTSHSQPSFTEIPPRPSVLTLPGYTNPEKKDASKENTTTQVLLSPDADNLFGSDSITGATSAQKTHTASTRGTTKTTQSSKGSTPKNKDKTPLSIFDDSNDDLFKKVKPRPSTKKADAPSFLEDDDDDIFGMSNSSTPTLSISEDINSSNGLSKQDISKDEVAAVPKPHKNHKEKPIDSSLFDDNIDIFADLMDTVNPKQTSKRKGETKSIFDDDMEDIFSTSTVKSSVKAPPKSKKTPASQEPRSTGDFSDIFDDPLNALGGK